MINARHTPLPCLSECLSASFPLSVSVSAPTLLTHPLSPPAPPTHTHQQGSCEPDHHAWAPGKAFYIPPLMGCEEHDSDSEDEHSDHEDEDSEDEGDGRRLVVGGTPMSERDFILAANVNKTRLRVDDVAQQRWLESIGTPAGVLEVGGFCVCRGGMGDAGG
jgi:hypothetical protein